jgi:hypothetical protein
MVTMVHKESNPTSEQDSLAILNLNNFKMIEAIGLKMTA